MADFSFSDVASKIQPPKEGMSLADMVQMARGIQSYQQAGQLNPLQAQKAQLELEQLQKTMPLSLREQEAKTSLAEGVLKPSISKATSEAETAQTGTKSAQLKLSGEKLQKVLEISGARATDPEIIKLSEEARSKNPEVASQAKKRLHQLNYEDFQTAIKGGLNGAEAMESFGHITSKIDTNPEQIPSLYQNAVRIGSGSQGQLGLQTPKTGVNAAGQTTAVNPVTGQYEVMGKPETNPMSARSQTMTDPVSGDTMVFDLDARGNPTNVRFLKGAGANKPAGTIQPVGENGPLPAGMPNLQSLNRPQAVPSGENVENIKQFQTERNSARDSASSVATGLNNIETVMKYLPLAQTGNLSGAASGLQSVIGNFSGSKKEELAAAARDIIQKNIADLALAKNSALGGKFAENLKLAETSLANAEKNPTAIASSMAQLKPLLQHVRNYQIGLEKAISKNGDNVGIKRIYDNAMNVAFDPLALQLGNAHKTGGAEGVQKFVKENHISPAQQNELINKLSEYQKLVKGELQ